MVQIRPEHVFLESTTWSDKPNETREPQRGIRDTDARLDSNREVTPDAFVKGNLNFKVWGMASGIVDERWEGNWP